MIEPSTRDALFREWARLGEVDRKRVLEYARSLSEPGPRGVPGASLVPLAGTFPESDIAEIEAAIEDGCERVNPGGW